MSRLAALPLLTIAAFASGAAAQTSFQLVMPPLGISGLLPTAGGITGTGVCIADFDGDGDVDVVLPQQPGMPLLYYRNDGGMQFTDATATAGLGVCNLIRCINAADVDNDGDQDLYVGNDDAQVQLFINDGSASFTDEATARGLVHTDPNYAATFGDYDRDGWLDVYVGLRTSLTTFLPTPNVLYRNTGNGYFVDVTASAGLWQNRPTLVATWMDYDEDGWPDVLVANDKGSSWGPNQLFRNNGDGTFTDVSVATGTNIAVDGMCLDYVDVFNDGGVDFYCTDLPIDHLFQVWDPQLGAYVNATATYGLQGGGIGWAGNWFDFDNDCWQDLHVVQWSFPNLLYRNPGQPSAANVPWTNEAALRGIPFSYSQYVAVTADFDDDGKVDLLQRFDTGPAQIQAPDGVGIWRNQVAGGNWLKFRARGRVSNRDGLGARVEVVTGALRQRQWVRSAVGYLSSSDRRPHFGLGTATTADLVEVTWPSGQVQHLTDVPANQIVELVEPQLTLGAPVGPGGNTTLELSIPGDEGLPYYWVLSLSTAPGTLLPDGTRLPVNVDGLTSITLVPNPILPMPAGVLDANGEASAALHIPPLPWLSGLTFYATAITTDAAHFPLVRTSFPSALAITLQ